MRDRKKEMWVKAGQIRQKYHFRFYHHFRIHFHFRVHFDPPQIHCVLLLLLFSYASVVERTVSTQGLGLGLLSLFLLHCDLDRTVAVVVGIDDVCVACV